MWMFGRADAFNRGFRLVDIHRKEVWETIIRTSFGGDVHVPAASFGVRVHFFFSFNMSEKEEPQKQ